MMTRRKLFWVVVLASFLLVQSCSSKGALPPPSNMEAMPAAPVQPASAPASNPMGRVKAKVASSGSTLPAMGKRLIIYLGSVVLSVTSPDTVVDSIKKYTEQEGGYIVFASREKVVLRIPARKFQKAMDHIKTLGEVLNHTMEAIDVTKQYRDLELRLKNALAEREKLVELLKQAKDVKEILAIRKELRTLTEEIERMKAQLSSMKESITYSTITVELRVRTELTSIRPLYGPFSWIQNLGIDTLLRR